MGDVVILSSAEARARAIKANAENAMRKLRRMANERLAAIDPPPVTPRERRELERLMRIAAPLLQAEAQG